MRCLSLSLHWNKYEVDFENKAKVSTELNVSKRDQKVTLRICNTSATRHFGIRTLGDISAPVSRHFDTKNVVQDTSTRVPWSRKSRDTSTQDNSDETELHRWFLLNFGTNFMVPKCLGAEMSCGRSVLLPIKPLPENRKINTSVDRDRFYGIMKRDKDVLCMHEHQNITQPHYQLHITVILLYSKTTLKVCINTFTKHLPSTTLWPLWSVSREVCDTDTFSEMVASWIIK